MVLNYEQYLYAFFLAEWNFLFSTPYTNWAVLETPCFLTGNESVGHLGIR